MKSKKHLTAGAMRRLAIRAERRASAIFFDGRAASEQVAAEIRAESVVINPDHPLYRYQRPYPPRPAVPIGSPWRLFFSASELTGARP